MICNACRVLEQELVHGQIAPKKSSEEIAAMLLEIRGRLDEIREDTQYFQEFIRQNKIPLQMTQMCIRDRKQYILLRQMKYSYNTPRNTVAIRQEIQLQYTWKYNGNTVKYNSNTVRNTIAIRCNTAAIHLGI